MANSKDKEIRFRVRPIIHAKLDEVKGRQTTQQYMEQLLEKELEKK